VLLEFVAEIDLLGALSACPGGDCSTKHSSDGAGCYLLLIEVFAAQKKTRWQDGVRLQSMPTIRAMVSDTAGLPLRSTVVNIF
jgi:hypothetical protein